MKKRAIIKQPAGLGDILFCQKIAYKLQEKGYEILWPVIPEFLWLNDYIKNINFVNIDTFTIPSFWDNTNIIELQDKTIFVPLQTADQLFGGCMMDAKYAFTNLQYNDWSEYLSYSRCSDKENTLYTSKVSTNSKYAVVNKVFGSPPHGTICSHLIDPPTSLPIIEVIPEYGYSLFDWCKIFENAEEIHTVDTSILFILETLNCLTPKLFCYSRFNPPNFQNVSHLFKKQWHYVS